MHLSHRLLSMTRESGGVMIGHHLSMEDSLIFEGDFLNNLVN